MLTTATYLVSSAIAERSGLMDSRYRTRDGRFVLNDRDLSRVRFSPEEYIHGLEGVEQITATEAETLIRQNGYAMGAEAETETTEVDAEEGAPTSE